MSSPALYAVLCREVLYLPPPTPPPIVISHAMARDGSSGGVVRTVTVDQNGIEKQCVLGECDRYTTCLCSLIYVLFSI